MPRNTEFLIGDWLAIHRVGPNGVCGACRAFAPEKPSEPPVARLVAQNVILCRTHALMAANDLAKAAERLLELAAE